MKERKKLEQLAHDQAKKSPCKQRKVGCIIWRESDDAIIGQGYNFPESDCDCLDGHNIAHCPSDVVHAEIAALNNINVTHLFPNDILYLFVTQPPCNNCISAIQAFMSAQKVSINIVVCEQFLKFDDSKPRFDLIPPEWMLYEAKVLTHGAKKYKPNNWRHGDIDRYIAALYRHLNAYQSGEWLDDGEGGTGLPHLVCVRVNAGFLLTIIEEQMNND